jgi:hypothetical protein
MSNDKSLQQLVTWERTLYTLDDALECIIPVHDKGTGYFRGWINEECTIALVECLSGRKHEIWGSNLVFMENGH